MIKLENVSKLYGGKPVFDSLNLTLAHGDRVAIMGPSGCGKTTALMMLAGLEVQDGGNISGLDNKRVSMVFQDDRLCENLSLYANVKIVCPPDRKRADITSAADALGLGDSINKAASKLSGGMRRRAAILRAMLAEFDLLLLDEPFNGLDAEAKRQTAKFILDKLDGRAVLLVTHNPEDAELLGCKKLLFDEIAHINK